MSQKAFTGGVDPGGLWSQNDIRILICYILASVDAPLSEEDISEVIQGRALANYFETADALAALEKLGHVVRNEEGFQVTGTGRQVADGLDTSLPLAVRDKALEAALLLLEKGRARRENSVEIRQEEKGYRVICRVSGGQDLELMAVSLYVPDRAQARMVEENFYQDPNHIYKLLLTALTGE